MSMVSHTTGAVIFRQGDAPDHAYMVDSGSVEISLPLPDGGKRVLAILGPGEIFGEMGLIDMKPRSATATTAEDTTLVQIDRMQILGRLEASDPVVVHMFKVLTKRLREANQGSLSGKAASDGSPADDLLAELKLERDIRDGIENGEFRPFLQPIVEMPSARVAGFEALVRWRRPDGSFIPPMSFIPLAERTQIVRGIDLVVMDGACGTVVDLNAEAPGRRLFASVNLSAHHFSDHAIVDAVERTLAKHSMDPGLLKLEITEGALITHAGTALDVLRALKGIGVNISLDDFGTGYSSLSYLHRYPIDVMKIDRSFVVGMRDSDKTARILQSVVQMARSLGMHTVAEGIEEEEQARVLSGYGVEFGQGWLFGRPTPPDAARGFL